MMGVPVSKPWLVEREVGYGIGAMPWIIRRENHNWFGYYEYVMRKDRSYRRWATEAKAQKVADQLNREDIAREQKA